MIIMTRGAAGSSVCLCLFLCPWSQAFTLQDVTLLNLPQVSQQTGCSKSAGCGARAA